MLSVSTQAPFDLLTARPPGFPPGAALQDQIRRYLATRYDLCEHAVPLGGSEVRVLGVRDTNALVDAITPGVFAVDERLPFWAELWSAALGLAAEMLVYPGLKDRACPRTRVRTGPRRRRSGLGRCGGDHDGL